MVYIVIYEPRGMTMRNFMNDCVDMLVGLGLVVLGINAILMCGLITFIIWKIIMEAVV